MTAHQHWRIYVTEGNATQLCDVGTLEMRATAGGATQCTGGTPSASTAAAGAYGAVAGAFDASTTTSWQTTTVAPAGQWLRYSFAAPVTVTQVAITASTLYFASSPKAVDVQWSDDGSAWTTAFSGSNMTSWTAGSTILITDGGPVSARVTAQSLEVLSAAGQAVSNDFGKHRYWRLYITANNGDANWTAVGTLALRGASGGSSLATGGTASASSDNGSGWEAALAFDGSLSATTWMTANGAAFPHWLAYDFGSGNDVAITEIALSPSNNSSRMVTAGTVQYSDNGSSWTDAWTVSFPVGAIYNASSVNVSTSVGIASRVTAQSLEVLVGTYEQRIAKSHAFAILTPTGNRIAITKSVGYALLTSLYGSAVGVSKLSAYAVTGSATGIGVSNLAAYAVPGSASGIGVSNLAAYAVYDPAYVPVSTRRRVFVGIMG